MAEPRRDYRDGSGRPVLEVQSEIGLISRIIGSQSRADFLSLPSALHAGRKNLDRNLILGLLCYFNSRLTRAILCVEISMVLKQVGDRVDVFPGGSVHQGRSTRIVPEVYIGVMLDQQFDRVFISVSGRVHERCLSFVISGIDVGAPVKQSFSHSNVEESVRGQVADSAAILGRRRVGSLVVRNCKFTRPCPNFLFHGLWAGYFSPSSTPGMPGYFPCCSAPGESANSPYRADLRNFGRRMGIKQLTNGERHFAGSFWLLR